MISYCIKTNNTKIIEYLLNEFEKIKFPNIYYSSRSFKKFENFIIHYKEENIENFNNIIIDIIVNLIIKFYEEKIIKKIININYFYFETNEKLIIFNNCNEFIKEQKEELFETLFKEVENYLQTNNRIYIDGIVNFRLNEYIKKLDNIVDIGVNQYIIEKEYREFISMLKVYVNSTNCKADIMHLIYINGESILLDKEKNIVKYKNEINTVKYLSDISFSSNDMALNTLLSLLPNRIEIHIIDREDEFINTLKLIFESRIRICNDCNICRKYRKINNVK